MCVTVRNIGSQIYLWMTVVSEMHFVFLEKHNTHTHRCHSNRLDLNQVVWRLFKWSSETDGKPQWNMKCSRGLGGGVCLPPPPSFSHFLPSRFSHLPLSSHRQFLLLHTFSCCNEISYFCSCCIFWTASPEWTNQYFCHEWDKQLVETLCVPSPLLSPSLTLCVHHSESIRQILS